MSPYAIYDGLL